MWSQKKKNFIMENLGKLTKIASRPGQVLDHQNVLIMSILTGKIEGKRGLDRKIHSSTTSEAARFQTLLLYSMCRKY